MPIDSRFGSNVYYCSCSWSIRDGPGAGPEHRTLDYQIDLLSLTLKLKSHIIPKSDPPKSSKRAKEIVNITIDRIIKEDNKSEHDLK